MEQSKAESVTVKRVIKNTECDKCIWRLVCVNVGKFADLDCLQYEADDMYKVESEVADGN